VISIWKIRQKIRLERTQSINSRNYVSSLISLSLFLYLFFALVKLNLLVAVSCDYIRHTSFPLAHPFYDLLSIPFHSILLYRLPSLPPRHLNVFLTHSLTCYLLSHLKKEIQKKGRKWNVTIKLKSSQNEHSNWIS
jgi:cytochrome c biogenesis factor